MLFVLSQMTTQPREEMKTKGNRTIGGQRKAVKKNPKKEKNKKLCQVQCKTVKREVENQQIC